MEVMETADMVTILMGTIHTVTILTVHITPMAEDMVTTHMAMEWVDWDGAVLASETVGTETE